MKTQLSLLFPEINSTENLYVVDSSYYNPDIPMSCQQLSILVPGRTTWVKKEFNTKNFSAVFNSSALGLTKIGTVGNLPDGFYDIEMSIAPNDKIWVRYYYFKVDSIMKRLREKGCSQFTCNISKKIQEENLRDLDFIEDMIMAAKTFAEEKADIESANQLYKEADRLLSKIEKGCTNC